MHSTRQSDHGNTHFLLLALIHNDAHTFAGTAPRILYFHPKWTSGARSGTTDKSKQKPDIMRAQPISAPGVNGLRGTKKRIWHLLIMDRARTEPDGKTELDLLHVWLLAGILINDLHFFSSVALIVVLVL